MADPKDARDVVDTAVAVGSVSKAAAPAAAEAVEAAHPNTGIDVGELKGSRVFLVDVEIDNSGSMQGMEEPVREAFREMKRELVEAAAEAEGCEVLISVTLLHGGLIQPYCRVEDCIDLDDSNHVCDGDTPFYNTTNALFGTLLVKVKELADSGRTAQTFTALITDGKPTDGPEEGNCPEPFDPAKLHQVIAGLTETKQHIVCGVNIGGAAGVTFDKIGIRAKWQLDPQRDGYAFKEAIAKVSRASRSASKGAGAFQTVANDGFR